MPVNLDPNRHKQKETAGKSRAELKRMAEQFDYDYPEDLDLRPGFKLHDELLDEVMKKARESARVMRKRHSDWKRVDKNLKMHVHAPGGMVRDEVNVKGSSASDEKDERTPGRMVMPVSEAIMETFLSFMTTAFLEDQIFRLSGWSPDDVIGAKLLERVINKHADMNSMGLNLHTAWRDMFAYGVGAASITWQREYGKRVETQPIGFLNRLQGFFNITGEERTESDYRILQEGNDMENIDPYRLLLDPNTPPQKVQEAEFIGWLSRRNFNDLLRQESGPGSDFFNVKYLEDMNGESSILLQHQGRRGDDDEEKTVSTQPVDLTWMYMDIIPDRWDLGDSETPEKWVFAVAGDRIIVNARPTGLVHGDYPVAVGAPDTDGYSVTPSSKMMSIMELQKMIDFLYTSHMENLKRAVNNNFVVDPTLVNIHDVQDPKPGKIIRMRKKAWGQGGIDQAIQQLDVADVTQQNVEEAQILQSFAQQGTGANANVLGQLPNRSSRISAQEIEGVRSSSLSRLERPAKLISMQFMQPIAEKMAEHAQQMMTEEQFVRVTSGEAERLQERFGNEVEVENNRLKINPLDIVVRYEVKEQDASFPGQENAQVWTDLFQILGSNQQLAQNFDLVEIFKHIATQLGAKNVSNFELNPEQSPQVVPDEQVEEERRRGNIAPVEEAAQAAQPQGNGAVAAEQGR